MHLRSVLVVIAVRTQDESSLPKLLRPSETKERGIQVPRDTSADVSPDRSCFEIRSAHHDGDVMVTFPALPARGVNEVHAPCFVGTL